MITPQGQRKSIQHFEHRYDAHELNFCCLNRLPLLCRNEFCILLSRAIESAVERHGFALHAFVFMPDHVHLIVRPRAPTSSIARLLFAIKRPVSFRARQCLERHADPLLAKLTLRGRYRFWQQGPGYDRNIRSTEAFVSGVNYVHMNPVRRGLCSDPSQFRWSSWRQCRFPESPIDYGLPRVTRRVR